MQEDNIPSNKTVLHWLNSLKGLGVILIILDHLLYDSQLIIIQQFTHSFLMPLFFILSGYLQKDVKNGFLKKRAKRLLFPFFVFAVVGLPVFGLRLMSHGAGLIDIFMDSFYVRGIIANNPLWFLVVLFEISVFIAITKIPQQDIKYQFCIYVAIVILGRFVYALPKDFFPLNCFGLNRVIICTGFYILGILIRKVQLNAGVLFALLLLIINIVFGMLLNINVSLYNFRLGEYFVFQVAAISGSIGVMIFCKIFLDRKGFLENISKYAILFLGTQYFFIIPFRLLMRRMHLSQTTWYDVMMCVFIVMFVLCTPLVYERLKKRIPLIKVINGELV